MIDHNYKNIDHNYKMLDHKYKAEWELELAWRLKLEARVKALERDWNQSDLALKAQVLNLQEQVRELKNNEPN